MLILVVFAPKTNLSSLKTEIDKIDADKLKNVPADLTKLNIAIKNDLVKKTEYNILKTTKVDNIDITDFVKKTEYNTLKTKFDGVDTSQLVKKTDFNSKVTEIEGKIADSNNLVKNTDFVTKTTEIENKISSIDDLVKKTDFDSELKKTNDIANENQSKYSHLENELKMFTLGYFKGKNYFEDSNLNYLIFEPNPAAFSTVELFVAKL